MSTVISITIKKGGSAKTTTAVNLASALSKKGKKVLLIDMDSQMSASTALGVYDQEKDIKTVLDGTHTTEEAIVETSGFYLLPGSEELSATDQNAINDGFIMTRIHNLIEPIKKDYDYVIIDTPPASSLLVYSALNASDAAIIPAQIHALTVKGTRQALGMIKDVENATKRKIDLIGILPTMYQSNTNIGGYWLEKLQATYGDKVLPFAVPLTVRVIESQSIGRPLLDYAPDNTASEAYRVLADKVIERYG